MKKLYILLILAFCSLACFAQKKLRKQATAYFPHPSVNIYNHFSKNMVYPQGTPQDIVGATWLDFYVEPDGRITNIIVKKPLHPLLDEEAIRLLNSSPEWIPAKNEDGPIRMKHSMPVYFSWLDTTAFRDMELAQPSFDLNLFLQKNLNYPQIARDIKIQGRVLVRFIINEDGSISDVFAVQSIHPSIDDEALRVIRLMPKWKPAKNNGVPVKSIYSMPLRFTLH